MANKTRYDDLNTGMIAYATFVSTILLLVIILLIRALCFYWVEGEEQRKLADAHYVQSDTEIARQKAVISEYGKATVEVAPTGDGADGQAAEPTTEERIHIPVDRAKELLLEEATSDSEPSA